MRCDISQAPHAGFSQKQCFGDRAVETHRTKGVVSVDLIGGQAGFGIPREGTFRRLDSRRNLDDHMRPDESLIIEACWIKLQK